MMNVPKGTNSSFRTHHSFRGVTMIVLSPTPDAPAVAGRMAAPLESLEGRTVALLDNGKFNVAPFLDCVEELLRAEYGVRDVVRRRKANQNAPAPAPLLAE